MGLTWTTKVDRIAPFLILVYGSGAEKSRNNRSSYYVFNAAHPRCRDAGNGHVASPAKAAVIPSEYFGIRERIRERSEQVQWEIVQEFPRCGRVQLSETERGGAEG